MFAALAANQVVITGTGSGGAVTLPASDFAGAAVTVQGQAGAPLFALADAAPLAAVLLRSEPVRTALGRGEPLVLESAGGGIAPAETRELAQRVANLLALWTSTTGGQHPVRVVVALGDAVTPGGAVTVPAPGNPAGTIVLPAPYARTTVHGQVTQEA